MEKKEGAAAVKRTSSEQRKLHSRDAARCRRSQETEVFYELAHTLPLPRRVSTNLDKAAVMRVTLSYLRMRHLLQPATGEKKEEENEEEEKEDPMDSFYPQVLAGFIMVMTEEGDIIYLTDNVSRHIGITQLDLQGQSIYDFVHPCDQEELRDLLTPRPGSSKKPTTEQASERNFFLRVKSTLTSRGRTVNIKSATWKVLHCTGHMRPFGGSAAPPAARVMTVLCEPVPHPSSVEFPLDTCTFLTRHSMDLRFTHCEGRVTELVGYKPDDLIGRSAFEFHHALDSRHINKSLHTLLSKGQVNTSLYRFLANCGGFVWAETQATVLYSSKTSQPEAVVCLNFILSAVEQPDVVFSVEQTRRGQLTKAEVQPPSPTAEDSEISCDSDQECLTVSRKTEDVGSNPSSGVGLLCKLKEEAEEPEELLQFAPMEPEELLQLTPEAGDTVTPLTGDFVELSFTRPLSPNSVPDQLQDLCTPQLRQLLSPIFSFLTPSPSPPSSPDPEPQLRSCEDKEEKKEVMDTSMVEQFFAVWPEEGQKEEGQTLEDMEGMDLDMLAPYISMDDDFQLTFLSSFPEADDKAESSAGTTVVPARRKRTHSFDEEMPSQLMIQDKRQKQHPSSIEEELLLSHKLLGCLDETDQSDLLLEPGLRGRSQLLTDRDPVLGGIQGLCDTAALMRDIFNITTHLTCPDLPLTS